MGFKKNQIIRIFVFVVLVCLFYKYVYDGTEYMRSSIDNRDYQVRSGFDKQQRADLLAFINGKLEMIVNNLRKEKDPNDAIKRLIKNWDSGITIKEIGNLENDAAYVINKKNMSFCLQNSKNVNLPELNLITYVGIHELAHIMSEEIGHGKEFVKNFEFLLQYSKEIDYYDPILKQVLPLFISLDKLPTSDNYCGVSLANSIS